jgi:hypothetical protein
MNSIYLVVKSSDEADMLRRLLPPGTRKEIEFVVADDSSSAISTARTLLALGGRPVGLLVDSGTTDAAQIATQRETVMALMDNAAPTLSWAVFIAVPTMAEVFASRGAVNQIDVVQEIISFVKNVTK